MRAQAAGVPVIALGPADPVLEREARQLGARYLAARLQRGSLIRLVQHLLGAAASAEFETCERSDDIGDLWFPPTPASPVAQFDGPVSRFRRRFIFH
jgi:hypothetical protein